MTSSDKRRLLWCLAIFLLPSAAIALPQLIVGYLVPRKELAGKLLQTINTGFPKFSADALASMYHVSLAITLVIVACAAALIYCAYWLLTKGRVRIGTNLNWVIPLGLALALAGPILGALCARHMIDDPTTLFLFGKTTLLNTDTLRGNLSPLSFHWDARIIGALVFVTYNVAALTVAVTVATSPARLPSESPGAAPTADADGVVVQNVLLLVAAVLVAAMITVKFRFDVGLAMLGAAPTKEAPNAAYLEYNALASSITAYMAAALSLALAAIYLPGAIVLNYAKTKVVGGTVESILDWNRDNIGRLMRLAIIVSPPIVNKLIELLPAAPKG